MTAIGSLNEKPLHAALKEWYRRDGDRVEAPVDGFVADLLRDGLLIEIQTRGFSAMRRKFDRLLDAHRIRLVHPVAAQKWIVKLDDAGDVVSRRRSPKRGIAADVCEELVSFPSLLSHPHFTLEIALVEEEEIRRPNRAEGLATRWVRRRGTATGHGDGHDRAERARRPPDAAARPTPRPVHHGRPGRRAGPTRHLAQEVAYCLRVSGAAETIGRDKRGYLYRLP